MVAENDKCVFCQIVQGEAPADVVAELPNSIVITPLGPVTPGHVLVIPRIHAQDFASSPMVTGAVMQDAAAFQKTLGEPANLITSKGAEATQTVFHLHVHLVPRREGDGLHLPWTGQVREKGE